MAHHLMDSIDEAPEQTTPADGPARRAGGLVCMLAGLAIFAYCIPEIGAALRDRDAAAGVIKRSGRLADEPPDEWLAEDPRYSEAEHWMAYKASRTRLRLAGVLGLVGGMSLTGGIALFLGSGRGARESAPY